ASIFCPRSFPFSEVRSFPGLLTHSPSALSREKPVSISPLVSVNVLPEIEISLSMRPNFCPQNQHSAHRICASGQPRKLMRSVVGKGDEFVESPRVFATLGL